MADTLTPEQRSWNMSRVRSRDTKPEIFVRSIVHRLGFRFTVNGPKNRRLPGRPDLVLPRHRTVIFVHGCFWHRHEGCRLATTPSSRQDYWLPKFARNVERDQTNETALRREGWNVVVIWECEINAARKNKSGRPESLAESLARAIQRPPRKQRAAAVIPIYPDSASPSARVAETSRPSATRKPRDGDARRTFRDD